LKTWRGAWLALAALGSLPLPAAADTLYKCVDAMAVPSIQNEPGGMDQTPVWARDTPPEPPPTPEQAAAAQAREEQRARDRAAALERQRADEEARRLADEAKQAEAAIPPPPAPATTSADPCDDAKAFMAQVRAKPWLQLDDAQMQRLYGWVAQQCAAPASSEQ
jgi:hypothetical protein